METMPAKQDLVFVLDAPQDDTTAQNPNGAFPFMKLPAELRIKIYKLTLSYDSIHDVARKISKLKCMLNPFQGNNDSRIRRRSMYCLRKDGSWTRRYQMHTPSMLLLNKKLHLEAVHKVRRLPLDLSGIVDEVMHKHKLQVLDFVSIETRRKVSHIHVGEKVDVAAQLLFGDLHLFASPGPNIGDKYAVDGVYQGAVWASPPWQVRKLSKIGEDGVMRELDFDATEQNFVAEVEMRNLLFEFRRETLSASNYKQ